MSEIKILLVEDEFIIADNIRDKLEKLGYIVTAIVSSGIKALKEIETNRPDLILMDINIKGDIDGIETAEQIKKRSAIPVIFLTAYSDAEVIERAQLTEPYGYLLKPLKDRELAITIKMALYKHATDKKLSSLKAMLVTVFNSVGVGMIITSSVGNVLLINSVASKIIGKKKEDAIGKPISEVFLVHENVSEESSAEEDDELEQLPFEALGTKLNIPGTVPKKVINFGINNSAELTISDNNKIFVYGSISPIKNNHEIIGSVIAFQRSSKTKESSDISALLRSGIKTDVTSFFTS